MHCTAGIGNCDVTYQNRLGIANQPAASIYLRYITLL